MVDELKYASRADLETEDPGPFFYADGMHAQGRKRTTTTRRKPVAGSADG